VDERVQPHGLVAGRDGGLVGLRKRIRVKAASVYWMTQEFNAEGRALYDTLARRTSFIRYER